MTTPTEPEDWERLYAALVEIAGIRPIDEVREFCIATLDNLEARKES